MSRSALLRTTAVVGLVGAVALAGPSSAAPAACNLIKDAAGDGGVITFTDDVDIVSADLGSDAKTITAVIRLAGDPSSVNPEALGGKNFSLGFLAPGSNQQQTLTAGFDPVLGVTYRTGYVEDVNGVGRNFSDPAPAKGKVEGNVITISAPIDVFAARVNLKPAAGKRATGLVAEARGLVGVAGRGLLLLADDATGGAYEFGTPTCVKAV